MADRFIHLTNRKTRAIIVVNLRHVNIVTPNNDGGAHIGINNYMAQGFDTVEPFEDVIDLILDTPKGHF